MAARFAQKYTQRIQALILLVSLILLPRSITFTERWNSVGVPYHAPEPSVFPTAHLNKLYKPMLGFEPFGYMEWFLTPGAPNLISEDVSQTTIGSSPRSDSFKGLTCSFQLESCVHALLSEDVGRSFCDRGVLQANLSQDVKVPCAPWVKDDVSSAFCLR